MDAFQRIRHKGRRESELIHPRWTRIRGAVPVPPGSPAEGLFGHPGYFHTGAGVHLLSIMPDARLVIVFRLNTDGQWIDPGDTAQMQLVMMIVNTRL